MENDFIYSTYPAIDMKNKKPTQPKSSFLKPIFLLVVIATITAFALNPEARNWINPQRISAYLEDFGPLAPIVFIFMMMSAVVISPIPSLPLDAAAGAFFGPFLGTVYSVIGAEGGALIGFFIARFLGRETVARLLKTNIGFCDRCTEHHLFLVIMGSRLLPIFSFDLISYGAGLTRISTRGFALATFIGMIPPTFAFNYFGSGVFSGSIYSIFLAGLAVLVFLLGPRLIKKYNPWGIYERLEAHAPVSKS